MANLTASRVSVAPMRKVRVFTPTRYLSIDLLEGRVKHFRKGRSFEEGVRRLKEDPTNVSDLSLRDFVTMSESEIQGEEPLFNELRSFCQTMTDGATPPVTGEDGLAALTLATEIQRIVENDPVV